MRGTGPGGEDELRGECLMRPTVLTLTEAQWLERTAFPLGMSEGGDLFYGTSPGGPR